MARGATEELDETGVNGGGKEDEGRMLRLLLGSRLLRRGRLRRALIADLLGARGEADQDEDEGDDGSEMGSDDDRRLIRMLIGGRILRRRRIRRALLAHLLGQRAEADEGEEDEGDEDEGGRGDERRLVRLLIASRMLRRRRVRRVIAAQLLKQRAEADEGEEDEGDEDGGEAVGSDDDNRVVRLLIGSRIMRRRRVRRAILAHLLGERAEARGEEEEDEGDEGDDSGDNVRRLMRFLVARRGVRRRRGRRAVAAGLMRNGEDED